MTTEVPRFVRVPTFTESYRRYALALITTVYTLNLVDRYVFSLLLQPIKEDLHLSDTELGFLTGIAFGLFYATLGLPIGRWADRSNRTSIISIAIGLWGMTVMACLFVGNYSQLVLARVAASVGEAGCKPPTYSLVGDYFPEPGERTRALAVYMTGGSIAVLVGFSVGGWLNALYGWRIAFFLMGIPGLVLAVLVKLTLVEPRSAANGPQQQETTFPSMAQVLETLWHQRSCRHLCAAIILLSIITLGLMPWYASFMVRSHGMGIEKLGLWLGVIYGLGGIVGVISGGYAFSRWFGTNEPGQMRLTALSTALLLPCFVAFLTLPRAHQALIALIPAAIALMFPQGPIYALMQRLVRPEMRATVMATIMLLGYLIGMGIGPQLVGILSDAFRARLGSDSLRYALLAMSLLSVWAAYHFWRVSEVVADDIVEVDRVRMSPARLSGLGYQGRGL